MFPEFCARPHAVQTMAKALEMYCAETGLSDPIDRQIVARRVMWAYKDGVTTSAEIVQSMIAQDRASIGNVAA